MLNSIYKTINSKPSTNATNILNMMNNSLLVGRNTQSQPYLIDTLGQDEFYLGLAELLSFNFLTSKLSNNFAELLINTELIESLGYDLAELVFSYKLDKYSLIHNTKEHTPRVRQGKSLNDTGIVYHIDTLNEAHQHSFKFDVGMLKEHFNDIASSLLDKALAQKGKEYVFDSSYEDTIVKVLQQYIIADGVYNLGGCNFDQRYRAISLQLETILNPISFKIGRALVKFKPRLLEPCDTEFIDDIYLFIAQETVGACIGSTIIEKTAIGKKSYADRLIPSDIVGKIWITRVYKQLDELFNTGGVMWEVPIEIDYTFSALMMVGCLLGYAPYIESCNGFKDVVQQDAWQLEGVPVEFRNMSKVLVANIYGSEEPVQSLSKGLYKDSLVGLERKKVISAVNKAKDSGKFEVVLALKNLLKKGSNIERIADDYGKYSVSYMGNTYNTIVQKREAVDSITTDYYTLVDANTPYVFENTKIVYAPDYEQHRNYHTTGLVHNLDPQALSSSIEVLQEQTLIDSIERPIIPVHDALIVMPHDVALAREGSRRFLVNLIENGTEYLEEYLMSIGALLPTKAPATIEAMELYSNLKSLLKDQDPIDLDRITGYCMK